ncbi:Mu homology domain-containing protein [Mycena galericulata]|nr:Mu homology domain-containing protein [Mycena galericulata]
MPELRVGLNDKVMFKSTGRTARGKAIEMEDVKFHQCFELMSYRLSTPVKPLIWVEATVESHKGSRVEYMVKVIAQFKRRSAANNVEIYVPVPDDADSPKFHASFNRKRPIRPGQERVVWKMKQLAGGKEFPMRAHFACRSPAEQDVEKWAPITVKYEIPYFTVSGIQVRFQCRRDVELCAATKTRESDKHPKSTPGASLVFFVLDLSEPRWWGSGTFGAAMWKREELAFEQLGSSQGKTRPDLSGSPKAAVASGRDFPLPGSSGYGRRNQTTLSFSQVCDLLQPTFPPPRPPAPSISE